MVNYQNQDMSTYEKQLNNILADIFRTSENDTIYTGGYRRTPENDIIYTECYRRDLTCPCCQKKNLIMFPEDGIKCPFCKDGFLTCDFVMDT